RGCGGRAGAGARGWTRRWRPGAERSWPQAARSSCWHGGAGVAASLACEAARRHDGVMSSGEYQRGYADPSEAPQGIELRTILIVGLVLVAVGAFIVAHALSAGTKLPPAAAQDIPASVGTSVPFAPDPKSAAAPLSASGGLRIEIPAI